jgi:hypothetical protein
MVVPQKLVEPCVSIPASDFTNLEALSLTGPESERFDQVAVIGEVLEHHPETRDVIFYTRFQLVKARVCL